MARTKGSVNLSTMIRVIQEAGRYEPGLENKPRESIKNVYEACLRNAGIVPQPKGLPAPAVSKPQPPPLFSCQEGATKVETVRQTVAPVQAPEPLSDFAKRVEARREEIRARGARAREVAAAVEKRAPPVAEETIVDTTSVEGRTVEEWNAVIEARMHSARQNNDDGLFFLDLADIPGWAVWAVDHWHRLGEPTVKTKALAEINDLLDKVREADKDASSEDDKARKAESERDPKTANKKREQAEKKRQRAAELRKQAQEVAAAHSIKHPGLL